MKRAFDCNICGKHIHIGDTYFSFEIGQFKIVPSKKNRYDTEAIHIEELFVFCDKCAINIISQKLNSLIKKVKK